MRFWLLLLSDLYNIPVNRELITIDGIKKKLLRRKSAAIAYLILMMNRLYFGPRNMLITSNANSVLLVSFSPLYLNYPSYAHMLPLFRLRDIRIMLLERKQSWKFKKNMTLPVLQFHLKYYLDYPEVLTFVEDQFLMIIKRFLVKWLFLILYYRNTKGIEIEFFCFLIQPLL